MTAIDLDRKAHRIRPLETSHMPRRHVVIDTEAHTHRDGHAQIQTWAVGAAAYLRHSGRDGGSEGGPHTATPTPTHYTTPAGMWQAIDEWCRPNSRVVVWAHNLAYDLRISRALVPDGPLLGRGWQLKAIVLERTASWASFTNGRRTLLCVDLRAWLPTELDEIAKDLGVRRRKLAYEHASLEQLLEHCVQDVSTTAAAVAQLLDFLTREDLGPFRPTGAGQSHAAWRRRFLTHEVIVHDDLTALAAERTAMWTGRCEAFQHGRIDHPGLSELDLALAYCHIAADSEVPARLAGATGPLSDLDVESAVKRYAVLAEIEVDTDVPVLPHAQGDRIDWPVGRFRTVVWDPELHLARQNCHKVSVTRAWLYVRAPALQAMARWVLEHFYGPRQPTPVEQRLLKHWSRTIVGRMALRFRKWEHEAVMPDDRLELALIGDLDDRPAGLADTFQVGRELAQISELTEATSSVPQITGWVMSEARRRLWRLMVCAGLDELLYVDTDSLIVTRQGAHRLERARRHGLAWSLTLKQRIRQVDIRGPRNLDVERERRVAGVPKTARRLRPDTYDGEVWRSIKQSTQNGELDRVVVMPRRYHLTRPDPRRTPNTNGRTQPHHINEV